MVCPPLPARVRLILSSNLLVAAALVGCGGPDAAPLTAATSIPEAPPEVTGVPPLSALLQTCFTPSGTGYLYKCWATQGVIEIATTSTESSIQDAIEAGINRWNTLLDQAPTAYRRRFSWINTATTAADVVIEVHGQDDDTFCGKEGNGRIHLFELGSTDCPTTNSWYGDIATVVAHELTTVIGWDDDVEGYGVSGISNQHCVSTFPSSTPGPLSSQACYHDTDGVMKLYRSSSGTVDLGDWQDYFGTKILAQSDVGLAASTVDTGQRVAITAQFLTAGPHAQYSASVAYGPANYQATFSPSGKAHQSGSNIVADAEGTVQVTLKPQSTPSGYSLWEPPRSEGKTLSLTITAPEPPPEPPFQVDSIWADQMPITTPGWTTVHARTVSSPGTPVAIRWIVIDSRTPAVADTVFAYGHQIDYNATAGSYTLAFRARPQYGSTLGLERYQDIPVCTGDALIMMGSSSDGGTRKTGTPPETEAVGGCGGEN